MNYACIEIIICPQQPIPYVLQNQYPRMNRDDRSSKPLASGGALTCSPQM